MDNEQNKNKEFLTIKEAGELIGVHSETIRRWHLHDGLKVFQYKNTLRINKQDLLDFLSKKKS